MRKPVIYFCDNKGADQLCSNCEADQCLCFRRADHTIPLISESNMSSLLSTYVLVQLDLCDGPIRKPHCRFSHDAAQSYAATCM